MPQGRQKVAFHFLKTPPDNRLASHQHRGDRLNQFRPMEAESLTKQSFGSVANDRPAYRTPGHQADAIVVSP